MLRRALAKYKEPLIEEIRREFFACAKARGHDDDKTVEVWNLVRGFSGYAFCKAHSTAYGVEAYQSAWLKRYYPVEFMAAVLSNGKGFYHPLVYVLECHRLGIKLLPPCVSNPGPQFSVEGQCIRVPVTRVKGLTERTTTRILHDHTNFLQLPRSYHGRSLAPRKSTPSVSIASACGLNASLAVCDSSGCGHENVPCSSRLVSTHRPVPSQQRILRRVRRRLQNTKSAPTLGSSPSRSVTTA